MKLTFKHLSYDAETIKVESGEKSHEITLFECSAVKTSFLETESHTCSMDKMCGLSYLAITVLKADRTFRVLSWEPEAKYELFLDHATHVTAA